MGVRAGESILLSEVPLAGRQFHCTHTLVILEGNRLASLLLSQFLSI